MPLLFVFILAGYLLGNVYIFVKGLHALSSLPLWGRALYGSVFWLLSALLFLSFIFRNAGHHTFTTGALMFRWGAAWLVFVLYMIIFLACTDLIRVFNKDFNCGFFIALGLTITLLIYGFVNYQHTRKQVINIVLNKHFINDSKAMKIVGVSDLHLGLGTDMRLLHNNIDMINAEKPDAIIIAGDLFDNSIAPVIAKNMDVELNRLEAPVYFALGNHDYMSGVAACADFIRQRTKITLLRDSLVTLPNGLQILGRDDCRNRYRLLADELRGFIDPSLPLVIIDHQPVALQDAQTLNADLQFSGHTHHGQVIPLSWLTDRLFDLSYGFRKNGKVSYFVSSGLSLWGPPFRIGSNCEFVVFNILTD